VTPDEAVVAVLEALETARIPYMIVGSLASNVHGIPRSTRDADVLVELAPGSLDRFARALPPDLILQPQAAFEGITGTVRHLVTLSGSPFVCELFVRSDDEHDRARFERRQMLPVLGHSVFVASAEDMVITKLRWALDAGRLKDRDDVRNILAVRGDELDWDYMLRWALAHGTTALLDEIRRSLPE
jgi:hypothetical protein